MRGRIKALHSTFGFIRSDELAAEFFFHADDVVGAIEFEQLTEGDGVSFEPAEPQPAKGPRAQQVAWQEGKG